MKRLVWLVVPLLVATACKGGGKADPILALSAEESLVQGKSLLEQEKFFKARRYLTHAFEVAPNTAMGREALLLAADTFYLQGGQSNYVQAEAKYRDYQNRFPTSEYAPYVQFQLGNCLAKRTKKADRDQTPTEKALQAYDEVLRLFPTSEYAAQARDQIRVVRSQLAEHEFGVGRFYLSYGIPIAAINRLTELLEKFPDYEEKDKALFFLGQAYVAGQQPIQALERFGTLRQQYPDSPWIKKIPEVTFDAAKAAERAAAESEQEKTEPTSDEIKGGS